MLKGNGIERLAYGYDYNVTTDKTSTQAELVIQVGDHTYTATGSSFRVSGDKYDEHSGSTRAVLRAVQQLETMLFQEVENLD